MKPPPPLERQTKHEMLYSKLQEMQKSFDKNNPKLLQKIQEIQNELLDLVLTEPEQFV